jgi:plasmid stability protein
LKAGKRPIPPFGLRLPEDLKTWLEVRARENRRSMNSEITFLLDRYRAQQQRQPQEAMQ